MDQQTGKMSGVMKLIIGESAEFDGKLWLLSENFMLCYCE